MSFGKSAFSAGFIQKIIKVDPNVRSNRAYPWQKQL
jgi:predicted fused transcriptional regulator/phosphomethylpyrimidine kinase